MSAPALLQVQQRGFLACQEIIQGLLEAVTDVASPKPIIVVDLLPSRPLGPFCHQQLFVSDALDRHLMISQTVT